MRVTEVVNWHLVLTAATAAFAVFVLPGASFSKPLSSKACVALVNEHAKLLNAGVEKHMRGDPAVASSTLKPEQLASIDRFLFIEGQLRFRCPEVRLPGLGVPAKSQAQAAAFQKRAKQEAAAHRANQQKNRAEKTKGPGVPLPDRNPRRQANAAS